MAENVLTRQAGPLKTWQWAAIAGTVVGVVWYFRARAASNSSATTGTTSAPPVGGVDTNPIPGSASVLQPIIEQGSGSPIANFGALGAFITTTTYKTLTKAQQAKLVPITTAGGAHGYIPAGTVLPAGAHAGFVNISKPAPPTRTRIASPSAPHPPLKNPDINGRTVALGGKRVPLSSLPPGALSPKAIQYYRGLNAA